VADDSMYLKVVRDMYGLTPAQLVTWERLHALVIEALDQYDQGIAVNVEQQMADLAKELGRG